MEKIIKMLLTDEGLLLLVLCVYSMICEGEGYDVEDDSLKAILPKGKSEKLVDKVLSNEIERCLRGLLGLDRGR